MPNELPIGNNDGHTLPQNLRFSYPISFSMVQSAILHSTKLFKNPTYLSPEGYFTNEIVELKTISPETTHPQNQTFKLNLHTVQATIFQ